MSRNAAAPRDSAANSVTLPAEVKAAAPFVIADATIRSANAAIAASSQGEGSVRRARRRSAASTAVASSATSAGPTETVVSATPKSTFGRSRERSRHSTTVTRKTEKERSLAGRRSAPESGLGIGRDYDRRRGPVRGAPVDAHAHRISHRNLAAGRWRPCDARAGLRAVSGRARTLRPGRDDG